MSEFKHISLLDKNYQEVDSISEAVHILAQIGNEMITLRVAPGEPDGLAIAYTPNHERHEIKQADALHLDQKSISDDIISAKQETNTTKTVFMTYLGSPDSLSVVASVGESPKPLLIQAFNCKIKSQTS